jgi:hypothetical protein
MNNAHEAAFTCFSFPYVSDAKILWNSWIINYFFLYQTDYINILFKTQTQPRYQTSYKKKQKCAASEITSALSSLYSS